MRRIVLPVVGAMLLTGLSLAPAAAAPPPPTIVFPHSGDYTCYLDINGEGSPGSTVTVFDENAGQLGSTVVTGDGHWSIQPTATRHSYIVWAVASDSTGTSVRSAEVGFTYADEPPVRHYTVDPTVISPRNHDGDHDTARLSADVLAPGVLQYQIIVHYVDDDDVYDYPVRTPKLGAGQDTWLWDGRNDRGVPLATGEYRARMTWRPEPGTICPSQQQDVYVYVDDQAPAFARTSRDLATFYPRHDDAFGRYRDAVTVSARGLGETAWVRAQVLRHGGTVPLLGHPLGMLVAGSGTSWAWNGRHADGTLFPAGSYDLRFRMRDLVGNVGYTPRLTVTLSHRHVVARALTRWLPGNAYTELSSQTTCGFTVSEWGSAYEQGLRMRYCGRSPTDTALVRWRLAGPRGAVHTLVRLFFYGGARTPYPRGDTPGPMWLLAAWGPGRLWELGTTGHKVELHPLGSWEGIGMWPHREFGVVARFSDAGRADVDVRNLRADIRYGILAS